MGALWSYFFEKKDPKTPIKGAGARFKNILAVHHRGLIGSIVPLLTMSWHHKKYDHQLTVMSMWMVMFWLFLIQPVNVPVTGLIPIFMLPMCGVMNTDRTAVCYMNEGIVLMILSNMLVLLLNNSGFDRRVILWFMCSGDTSQFSAKRLVLKCSCAAFILSMFSSRLIVCSILTQYITKIFGDLQTSAVKNVDPNFNSIKNVILHAIQSSCSIGSIAIVHASFGTLAFRAIFLRSVQPKMTWPDLFNYLEYSSFAFPTALIMFILNLIYNMVLVGMKSSKSMSVVSMTAVRNALLEKKAEIPSKITLHEKLTLIFAALSLLLFFTRWTKHFSGWSEFYQEANSPMIHDSTVAAIIVVICHSLPSGYRFTRYLYAKKKSQLGPIKPESGILWWRFVDKNTNYGYIILIGSGVALSVSIRFTGLDKTLSANIGKIVTDQSWALSTFIICLVTVVLANSMSSVAAVIVWLPFIMNMTAFETAAEGGGGLLREGESQNIWVNNVHLGALAIGIGSSLGFMWPFLFTPAYFCHHTGKVPKLKMAANGIGSAIVCLLVLWIMITYYGPVVWNTKIEQIVAPLPAARMTTPKPEGLVF